jgi:3-isopropylmalate dehydrogenase
MVNSRQETKMKTFKIAVLPGDFIGPEVVDATIEVLEAISPSYDLKLEYTRLPFGGNALESHGHPLPEETKQTCAASDAVLMGSAGGPVGDHPWNKVARELRVESGILGIRKHLGLFANLRPVKVFEGLEHLSPLKSEVAKGTDLLIIRELTGGIYFGKPSHNTTDEGVSKWKESQGLLLRLPRCAVVNSRALIKPMYLTCRSSGVMLLLVYTKQSSLT